MISVYFYYRGEFICSEVFNSSAPDLYQQIDDFIVNLGYVEGVTYAVFA